MNGSTGEVYKDKVETKAAELSGDFAELMDLADKYTKLQVRTNADTPCLLYTSYIREVHE